MGYFDFGNSNKDDREDVFSFNGQGLSLPNIPIKFVVTAVFILISLFVLGALKEIYVNWLWFSATDSFLQASYLSIYKTVLSAKTILFIIGFFISLLILAMNILLAKRLSVTKKSNTILNQLGLTSSITKISTIITITIAIFIAITFGSSAANNWDTLYKFLNSVPFGFNDPVFDRDIAFYTFTLPAYKFIQGWLLGVLLFSTFFSLGIYFLSNPSGNFTEIPQSVKRHISVLVG